MGTLPFLGLGEADLEQLPGCGHPRDLPPFQLVRPDLGRRCEDPPFLSLTAPTLQGRFHVWVWPVGVGVWEPDPETVLVYYYTRPSRFNLKLARDQTECNGFVDKTMSAKNLRLCALACFKSLRAMPVEVRSFLRA
jgi:hypothetical protein